MNPAAEVCFFDQLFVQIELDIVSFFQPMDNDFRYTFDIGTIRIRNVKITVNPIGPICFIIDFNIPVCIYQRPLVKHADILNRPAAPYFVGDFCF